MKKVLYKIAEILFIIIISPVMIPWAIISGLIKSAKQNKEEEKRSNAEWKEFHNTKERIKFTNSRFGSDLDRIIYMSLESLYIVYNSNNVDTVYSRLNLLHDLLASTEAQSKLTVNWQEIVRRVVEKYNEAYYDRHVDDLRLSIILNPSDILNNWSEFNDERLFDAIHKYAISQDEYIASMKTVKAKENRVWKVIELIDKIEVLVMKKHTKKRLADLKNSLLATIKAME